MVLMGNAPRCLAVLAALTLALAACKESKGGPPPVLPVPVKVDSATVQSMPVQLTTIGTVEPCQTIAVKAQVSGEITKVWFKEGDMVKQDDVLFTIDPRPYEVALEQAEANLAKSKAQLEQARATLARDKAQAENARLELERDTPLLPQGTISKEEFDATRTSSDAAQATVQADEAAVKSSSEAIRAAEATIADAKLRLEYCTIRSPIEGRTGSLLIHQGNIVKANDTGAMVVINQIAPIYVSFALPEQDLAEVKARMAEAPLAVLATIPPDKTNPVSGTLTFIDNEVSGNSGTILMKGLFDNEDGRLWPGQFVEVALQVSVVSQATVVPERAVQTGQQGQYVYVVTADMKAEMRTVTAGETEGGVTVVTEGVQPGETVVTDGQVRLTAGAVVKVASDEAPKADGKPAAEGDKK
ncbi:MAG: Efflux transporter periplasmic adaptor subunit [Candidatus Hydrogenedentes bacterium]|nr:Efflux transporter periplasmic adaptor subunit [Candidatus Hydrogenedentota bacterium]